MWSPSSDLVQVVHTVPRSYSRRRQHLYRDHENCQAWVQRCQAARRQDKALGDNTRLLTIDHWCLVVLTPLRNPTSGVAIASHAWKAQPSHNFVSQENPSSVRVGFTRRFTHGCHFILELRRGDSHKSDDPRPRRPCPPLPAPANNDMVTPDAELAPLLAMVPPSAASMLPDIDATRTWFNTNLIAGAHQGQEPHLPPSTRDAHVCYVCLSQYSCRDSLRLEGPHDGRRGRRDRCA